MGAAHNINIFYSVVLVQFLISMRRRRKKKHTKIITTLAIKMQHNKSESSDLELTNAQQAQTMAIVNVHHCGNF